MYLRITRILSLTFMAFSIFFNSNAQNTYKIWDGTSYEKQISSSITAYTADKSKNTRVAVIICPGGSYHHLGMKHEGYDVAQWFQQEGINAFVLKYRVSLWGYHSPAMIEDLQRSIQFIKENAALWNIDTTRIGLIGFSAGGHLAASGGTLFKHNFIESMVKSPENDFKPSFIIPIYPVISMQDSIAHKRSRKNLLGKNYTQEQANQMSLEMQVAPDDPPMMVVVAKNDPVVDWRNGYYFYERLQEKGVKSKLILTETGGHGFGIDPKKGGQAALWNKECIKWLHEIGILNNNISANK